MITGVRVYKSVEEAWKDNPNYEVYDTSKREKDGIILLRVRLQHGFALAIVEEKK